MYLLSSRNSFFVSETEQNLDLYPCTPSHQSLCSRSSNTRRRKPEAWIFFFFCCNRTLSHAAPVIVESGADGRSRGGREEGRRGMADVHREGGRRTKKREAAAAAATTAEHQKQYGLLATLIRGVWLEVKGSGFPRHQRRAFGERPRLLLSPPSHSDDRAGVGVRGVGGT